MTDSTTRPPRTPTGRALLEAGSFPDDEGPPTWWSPGDLSPDKMRELILRIEAEAAAPDLRYTTEADIRAIYGDPAEVMDCPMCGHPFDRATGEPIEAAAPDAPAPDYPTRPLTDSEKRGGWGHSDIKESPHPRPLPDIEAEAAAPDHDRLVDIIEQAIFETDTGLEAALLAAERIEAVRG